MSACSVYGYEKEQLRLVFEQKLALPPGMVVAAVGGDQGKYVAEQQVRADDDQVMLRS